MTFSARDALRLATFWSQALRRHVAKSEPHRCDCVVRMVGPTSLPPGRRCVTSEQPAPRSRADDPVAEVERLIDLGAAAVDTTDDVSRDRGRQTALSGSF